MEYLVIIQGVQAGPFSESAIKSKVLSGELSWDELCWTDGMTEWQPIRLAITPPELPPPIPPSKKGESSDMAQVQGVIRWVSGLSPLRNFKLSFLFVEAFKRRSRVDIDTYFTCGCPKTTPALSEVSTDWPRPWFYLRMLIFGFIVLLGFCIAFQSFINPLMIPGLIIVGAFFVPLACVALFFELNVLRNISLYQVLKFIVGGGILSLIVALSLYSATGLLNTFLGATSAGIVEEIAKALAAVVLIRGTLQYKWILNGILVGSAVGAGFAGFESAGYILAGLFDSIDKMENLSPFYQVIVTRAVFSPFCHVVWTACVVGALWRVKKDQPFRVAMFFHKDFLRIFIFVILLHMLWNSGFLWLIPGNIPLFRIEILCWLVSLIGSWYLALLLVQQGLFQVEEAKQVCSPPLPSGEDSLDSGSQPGNQHNIYSVLIVVIAGLALAGSLFLFGGRSSFENSLGMKFVAVPGTDVLFSVWDTRVKDFRAYAESSGYRQTGGIQRGGTFDAGASWENPGFSQTDYHPVVGVNWDEAKAFCKWLTEKERGEGRIGKRQEYRLPTKEEWNVAVGNRKYPWGYEWPPPKGAGNYNPSLGVDSYENTSPCGSLAPNRLGLYDMGGNAWQWCEAWDSFTVLCGGSWGDYDSAMMLSSYLLFEVHSLRCDYFGFRCVLGGARSLTKAQGNP